jgi:beta-lactamase regulating signal transducer with metallopeptidase domain
MFFARGIAVSFSVFVMVYCVLSLAVCFFWRTAGLYTQRHPVRRIADLLFALRIFPLVTAAVITAAFTVPSFLLLEPRAIDEPMGEIPLILGICGAVLGIFGVGNAAMAMRRASRSISTWTNEAQPVNSRVPVPVLRISDVVPAMTAAGIVRPRVLLSGAAESMLTANELQTALDHEVAHVRRRDNLRKLLLRFVAFPGMSSLEAAWLEATEMAADDAAVSNASEALDLAAALIKLSRLRPTEPPVDLTAALVHGPASITSARVERLIAWSDERLVSPRSFSPGYGLAAGLATVAVFALTYSQLLVRVHIATEWLVR